MDIALSDLALDGGGAAAKWKKGHAARQKAKVAKQLRTEALMNKRRAAREARADFKKRYAKWLKGWKRKCAEARAAGRPKPGKKGRPWRVSLDNPQVVDMTGRVFGRLTVIRSAPLSLTMRTSQKCRVWVVKCSCGSPEGLVNGTSLRQGNVQSCGCLKRERIRKAAAAKRVGRQKLAAAPLSIRVAELRHRIFKKGRIVRRDTMLLDAVRQILIQDEVGKGIRRYSKEGRAMLVRPAGVPAARGHGHRNVAVH